MSQVMIIYTLNFLYGIFQFEGAQIQFRSLRCIFQMKIFKLLPLNMINDRISLRRILAGKASSDWATSPVLSSPLDFDPTVRKRAKRFQSLPPPSVDSCSQC
jgi:hypothetical protein